LKVRILNSYRRTDRQTNRQTNKQIAATENITQVVIRDEAKAKSFGLGLTLSGLGLDLGLMASGLGLKEIGLVASNIYSAHDINYYYKAKPCSHVK